MMKKEVCVWEDVPWKGGESGDPESVERTRIPPSDAKKFVAGSVQQVPGSSSSICREGDP